MAKENMTIRIEPEIKKRASTLFKSLGLDLSTATDIFYRQALRHNGLPFEVKNDEPNEVTYAAMEEAERLNVDLNTHRFHSVDELFEELNS